MRGFSHEIALILFVVIFAIGGVAYLVASHADATCSSGLSPTVIAGQCESYIGQASPAGQTVTAYACVTKLSNTNWRTTALYTLSKPSTAASAATITNTGTSPIAGNQSVSQPFSDTPSPTATLNIFTNPQGQNPLTFSYSSGTVASVIAQNIHPVNLVTCSASSTSTSPPNTYTSPYLTISPTTGNVSFDRANPNLGVISAGIQFTPTNLYAVGFTIHNQTALQYALQNFTGGIEGFFNPSGNLQPGQTVNVLAFINPYDFADGNYTFQGLLTYLVPGTATAPQHWVNGPTIHLNASLTGPAYESYVTANPLSITETLHRSQVGPSGNIFGQPIMLYSPVGTTYQLQESLNAPQDRGFYNSGSIGPRQTTALQTYIDPSNYPNGTYQGSAVIQYRNNQGQFLAGPTVTYTITLTN